MVSSSFFSFSFLSPLFLPFHSSCFFFLFPSLFPRLLFFFLLISFISFRFLFLFFLLFPPRFLHFISLGSFSSIYYSPLHYHYYHHYPCYLFSFSSAFLSLSTFFVFSSSSTSSISSFLSSFYSPYHHLLIPLFPSPSFLSYDVSLPLITKVFYLFLFHIFLIHHFRFPPNPPPLLRLHFYHHLLPFPFFLLIFLILPWPIYPLFWEFIALKGQVDYSNKEKEKKKKSKLFFPQSHSLTKEGRKMWVVKEHDNGEAWWSENTKGRWRRPW